MSNGDSGKPDFWDCGWNGHCDCALWITRAKGTAGSPRSVALCGKLRPNRVRRRASLALCGKMRPDWARKPSICGLVRKDASKDGRGALHLSPCAERRGPIGHESRVSVAMCGKTRPYWARKPSICGLVRKDASKDGRGRPRRAGAQTEGLAHGHRGRAGTEPAAAQQGHGGRTAWAGAHRVEPRSPNGTASRS